MTHSSREPAAEGDQEPRPNHEVASADSIAAASVPAAERTYQVRVTTTALSRRELRQREAIADVHPAVETRRERRERELAAAAAVSPAVSESLAPLDQPGAVASRQKTPWKPASRTVSTSLFAQQIAALSSPATEPVEHAVPTVEAPATQAHPDVERAVPAEPVLESAHFVGAPAASVLIDSASVAPAEAESRVQAVTVEAVTEQLSIVTVRAESQYPRATADQPAASITPDVPPAVSLNEAPEAAAVSAPVAHRSADVAQPRAASSSVSASTKRRVLPGRRRRPSSTHPRDRKRTIVSTVVMVATAGLVATFALPAYAYSDLGSLSNSNNSASAEMGIQSLTVSSDAIQDAPRDGYSSTGDIASMDSTTGTTVSPTVQALAAELMADVASGKLVGSVPNHIPEIQNLANGVVVPNCGVDYRVLQAIKVAVDNFSKVGISDINRKCTGQIEGAGTASAHYTDGGGHAVDFYILNGHGLTGGDADSLKLIALLDPLVPPGSGVGQAECRGSISVTNFAPFDDTCTHDHFDFLNAKGVALKTP